MCVQIHITLSLAAVTQRFIVTIYTDSMTVTSTSLRLNLTDNTQCRSITALKICDKRLLFHSPGHLYKCTPSISVIASCTKLTGSFTYTVVIFNPRQSQLDG